MSWQYSASSHLYSDPDAGETIGQDKMRELADELHGKMAGRFAETASSLHERGASPAEWELALGGLLDETHALGYELARGGESAMTEADWDIVSERIAADRDVLATFAGDAGTGQLTVDETEARARLYADGARGGYNAGLAAAYDLTLPVYPPLHPRCECSWGITDNAGTYAAYWLVQSGNPCPECVEAEGKYSPFVG